MQFLCYPKCSTCKKARTFLQEQGLEFEERNIQAQNPTAAELALWQQKSGLPLKRFFNTSGLQYRALGLADRLPGMTQQEQLELLATDGMLVKRPILVAGDRILVGFRPAEWAAALQQT